MLFIEKTHNKKSSTPAGVAGLREIRGFYIHTTSRRSRFSAFHFQPYIVRSLHNPIVFMF